MRILTYINILFYLILAPELKFNFSSVTFDNTNVNTPEAYGTLYIEDKSMNSRLFPPSKVYLYICFLTKTSNGATCTQPTNNNNPPSPTAVFEYPFPNNVQPYQLNEQITSLTSRYLYIVLSDSNSHKYDSKEVKCIFIYLFIY